MTVKNYHVAFTFADGKWEAAVEGPDGDLDLPRHNSGQCGPKPHVTLTTCLELVRTSILDHHARR